MILHQVLGNREDDVRVIVEAAIGREREKQRRAQQGQGREKVSREVIVPERITVQELANRMAERAADIVKFLMQQGQMGTRISWRASHHPFTSTTSQLCATLPFAPRCSMMWWRAS